MILLTIIAFILLGIYFSYTDIKRGIIPNKYLLIYLLFILVNLREIECLLFLPIPMVVAFFLYYVKFWRAGDGKLFICNSLYLLLFAGSIDNAVNLLVLNLLLSVAICYIILFLILFFNAIGKRDLLRILRISIQRIINLETLIRIIASFIFFTLIANLGFESNVYFKLARIAIIYIILLYLGSRTLMLLMILAVLLFFILDASLLIKIRLELCPLLFLFGFVYFFHFYRILGESVKKGRIAFAPFLFLSTLFIYLNQLPVQI